MPGLSKEWFQQKQIEIAKKFAGEHFDRVVSSPSSLLELMRDPIPGVRAAAMTCGRILWDREGDRSFQDALCEAAIFDEGQPRVVAITALDAIFNGSRNRDIQLALARVVRDTKASNAIRNQAYRAILKIEHGTSLELSQEVTSENCLILQNKDVPLRAIDWKWLDAIFTVHH